MAPYNNQLQFKATNFPATEKKYCITERVRLEFAEDLNQQKQ